MNTSAPRRADLASPDPELDSALRQLVAAAAIYARAVRAAGRVAGLPTTCLFVCPHAGATPDVRRGDVAFALCPVCATLFAAGALRFADLALIFTTAGS
jgi:hypothetical protein